METDFQNPERFLFRHGLKNKNLSHILHRCQEQGESKPSFSPFFQFFVFSCFSHDFAGAVSASWR
jgi:hypothetical protein